MSTTSRVIAVVLAVICNAALGQVPIGGEVVHLKANHVLDAHGEKAGVRVLWLETTRLLNNSVWRPNSESIPISVDRALELAASALARAGVIVRKSQLYSLSLKPLFFDAAEDVWYYDVLFDVKVGTPVSETGQRYMELHRVVVLMDGTTEASSVQPFDSYSENIKSDCDFSRRNGLWVRIGCKKHGVAR